MSVGRTTKESIAENLLSQWRTCRKKRFDAREAQIKANEDVKAAADWEHDLLRCYVAEGIQMPQEVLDDLA